MFPDFTTRAELEEWMDDPTLSSEQLAGSTDAIERISRLTGGMRTSLLGLDRLIDREMHTLSILDVGTGNGAVAREFAAWGRRRGVDVDVLGIDLLEPAVEQARRQSRGIDGLEFRRQDLFEMEGERQFDVVHASLVLHHFPAEEAVRALRKMADLSRLGVIVNDLHRHPLHWLGSKMLLPAVTSNDIAIHDGPISVLRGFERREIVDIARRAGLRSFVLEWHFPFRWLLEGRR